MIMDGVMSSPPRRRCCHTQQETLRYDPLMFPRRSHRYQARNRPLHSGNAPFVTQMYASGGGDVGKQRHTAWYHRQTLAIIKKTERLWRQQQNGHDIISPSKKVWTITTHHYSILVVTIFLDWLQYVSSIWEDSIIIPKLIRTGPKIFFFFWFNGFINKFAFPSRHDRARSVDQTNNLTSWRMEEKFLYWCSPWRNRFANLAKTKASCVYRGCYESVKNRNIYISIQTVYHIG